MSGVESNTKVHVLLKHVGDAPPLQRKEVAIHREEKLLKVVAFIKKELNSKGGLFVYLKSSFSPNLNEQIGVLLDSFGTEQQQQQQYMAMPGGPPGGWSRPPPPPPQKQGQDATVPVDRRPDILDMSYDEYCDSFEAIIKKGS